MTAEPRYLTPRTPTRPNWLDPIERIAAEFGHTLHPWQAQVLGTLTERLPDGSPAYTDSTVTIMRQAGKTECVKYLALVQALSAPGQHIVYTSTTGQAARAVLLDELAPALRASRFRGTFSVRATNGAERIKFENGSTIAVLSSAKHAGHGDTLHMVLADEIWNAEEWLEQVRPTLITTGGQWFAFSTAGTPTDSEYLLSRVERGRADVEAGVTSGRFYAEWSIDLADIGNVEAYVAANPAIGYTIKADDIRAAVAGMDRSEAARAYGNQWVSALFEPVIPIETWNALEDNRSAITGDLVLAVDVSPARTHASIAAAGRNADGRWHVEVIDSRDGVAWVEQRLVDLVKIHHPTALYADSQAASIIPDLERVLGINIVVLTSTEHAAALSFLIEQVNADNLRHPTDSELVAALTAADVRPLGDGSSAWSRRKSSVTITPIVAVTVALHGAHLLQGSVGLWGLEAVVNEMRTTRWDPNNLDQFHTLLDTRPPEEWLRSIMRLGFDESTANAIIDALNGDEWPVDAKYTQLPPPRKWGEWAAHTMQPTDEAPPLYNYTTRSQRHD